MRIQLVLRYVGVVLLLNAMLMFVSTLVSLFNGMDTGFYPLLLSCLMTLLLGSFPLIFVSTENNITKKESYAIVVCSWMAACLTGLLPYILWGGEFGLVNSWFEAVSGYTTTGSTVLEDVEALPKGLLFWRSCTHLLGGVGIVLFTLVILPPMGRARLSLSNVELSSLAKDNYRYRVQKVINIILTVYLGLIASEAVLLRIAGMDWFDAVNHSFSTVATGGFSTKNLSIAYFDNVWIEAIITVFMILSGFHFGLLYTTVTGKNRNIFRSEVSRFYLLCFFAGAAAVSLGLWLNDTYGLFSSFRYGIFQLAALITTTGFATADSAFWPPFCVLLMLFFSVQCACSGSTSGGIKSDRVLILYKSIRARFLQLQHPNAVINVKLNHATLDGDTVSYVLLFIALYILVLVIGGLLLTLTGLDLVTSFSASVASLGNVGPGFGDVSSLSNYGRLSDGAKFICTALMLLGRLELFGFIQLFLFKSWK